MTSPAGPSSRSPWRAFAFATILLAGSPSHSPADAQDPAPEQPAPQPSPVPVQTPAPSETKPAPADQPSPSPSPSPAPADQTPAIPPAQPSEPAPAPSGQLETVLVLKDGTQVVGRLVSIDDEKYTMLIAGISTRFAKENVLRVMPQPPVEERYRQMRDSIDDSDFDRRVLLAEWLRDRKRYDLALKELESILAADANHPRARELKKTIELQVDLDQAAAKRKAARDAEKGSEKSSPDGESADPRESELSRPFPVLSEDQINLIRVYEIDLTNPPRLLIPKELIAQLISRYGDDSLLPATAEQREKLYQTKPSQILDLVYRLKAKDLYPLVRVMEDPASLQAFKREVHQGWVMNGCATGRCHGGEEAGRLMLKRSRPTDASTYYTNFLILDRFRLADGKPLINYDEPEKSPLIQMAMPRNLTTRPHPVVRNQAGTDQWKPAIRSVDDRRYRATLDWIRSMYRPRPDYGVSYTPPLPKGTLELAPAPNSER
ncbi:MAG: hypothetical protein JNM86_03490 [Phycisphaerae bacterium]|nr:hypothetical protein [Phycisphaerae bacterium]